MFWGCVIKEGQPLKSQKILESSEFAVLHLSSAIVDKAQKESTKLFAKNGKEADVIIANLNERNEQQNLDHYINCTQNVTLYVKGPAEIHLSGYFEPKGEDMDDDMFYGQEEGDEAEDSDEDEAEKPKVKAVEASLKQAKLNSARNAMAKPAEDESDIEEDEFDDEEDLEDMDDIDLDEEEDDSEEEIRQPKRKESPKPAAVVQDSDSDSDLDDQLVDDDEDDDSEEEANLTALIEKAKADKEKALKMQKGNEGKLAQQPQDVKKSTPPQQHQQLNKPSPQQQQQGKPQ